MTWSAHQRALLQAMGLRTWVPTPPAPLMPPPAAAPPPVVSAARPASVVQPVVQAAPPQRAPSELAPSVRHLDWPALRDAVTACRACGLCESRRQTVFGTGHPQAHWLVVGEAPGEQEDEQGEPFVGASGQLLDRMLAALQLTRAPDGPEPAAQRVYIANTLKCRPPRNRNPTPQEMTQCEPFLQRQIELLRPRIILAMGKFAVQSLLRSDEPVGKLRGRVHHYQGVPLVVTYHPAYLLRNLPEKARAWEDLCLAASVVQTLPAG
jgi:uracil-DNA glycosylase